MATSIPNTATSLANGLTQYGGPIAAMGMAQQFLNALSMRKKVNQTENAPRANAAFQAQVAKPSGIQALYDPNAIKQRTAMAQNDPTALAGQLPGGMTFKAGQMMGTNKYSGQPITMQGYTADMYGLPSNFGSKRYMELNPDVANSGMSAAEHYLKYGKAEGRNYLKPQAAPAAAPAATASKPKPKPVQQPVVSVPNTPPKIKQAKPTVDVNADPYKRDIADYEGVMKQIGQQNTPDFLQGLNEAQQKSAIATQGVFGGGTGEEESKYYLYNLLKQMQEGKTTDIGNAGLLPVEGTYLQSMGLPISGGIEDFLSALRTKYQTV